MNEQLADGLTRWLRKRREVCEENGECLHVLEKHIIQRAFGKNLFHELDDAQLACVRPCVHKVELQHLERLAVPEWLDVVFVVRCIVRIDNLAIAKLCVRKRWERERHHSSIDELCNEFEHNTDGFVPFGCVAF